MGMLDDPVAFDNVSLKHYPVGPWEFIFTPAMYTTYDMDKQYEITSEIPPLVEGVVLNPGLGGSELHIRSPKTAGGMTAIMALPNARS